MSTEASSQARKTSTMSDSRVTPKATTTRSMHLFGQHHAEHADAAEKGQGQAGAVDLVEEPDRAQPVLGVLVEGGGDLGTDLPGSDEQGPLREPARVRAWPG